MAKISGPFDVEDAENSAIAVQLFKTAGDLVRMLDRVTKSTTSLKDLYQPKVISYRLRLREICERLMFVDPIKHGKKAEDFLWKKVHYDFISLSKKLCKSPSWTKTDQYWLLNHIRLGLGTYHHLIFRLQSEYVFLGGDSFADFILPISFRGSVGQLFSTKASSVSINRSDDKVYEWALQAYQRFLICIGDLARYNQEFFGSRFTIASRYYHQALLVCSESSMPFNQLGTLVANNNYGFDSVYFYLRCTFYNNGFDGARANLLRVFDRNRACIETPWSDSGDHLQNRIFKIRSFLCKFIMYAEFVYKHPAEELNISFGELCESVIIDFQSCLELGAAERSSTENCCTPQAPCHLSFDVIFKMFVIALMCINKFEQQDSSNSLAATAFLLTSFSNLLYYILIVMNIGGFSHEVEKQFEESPFFAADSQDVVIMNLNSSEVKPNEEIMFENNIKSRKNKKLKRLRKKVGFEESDLSEDCDSSEDDVYETEESDASNENVEGDEDDDDDKNSIQSDSSANSDSNEMIDGECESKMSTGAKRLVDGTKSTDGDAQRLIESLLSIDPLVVTVKVCCDWLEAHPQIITASAQGSQKLWVRFVAFINVIVQILSTVELSTSRISCSSKIMNKAKEWSEDNWSQEYTLPEELGLNGLNIFNNGKNCKTSNCVLSWLSDIDQIVLRSACLCRFAYTLTKNPELGIQYIDRSGEFIYTHFSGQSTCGATITKGETREQKQNLMQNMAQLWLEAEVKELESSVQLLDRPRFSPYLIPDISVLLTHLDLIAQLMSSKIFIFILPIAALQHLDEKKKESSKARKAIRWLETEFQKHNRYLRAQKRHERLTLPLLKYPKRRDKDAWNVFSVLECAKYFSRYGSNEKASATCLSTILIAPSKMEGLTTTADEPKSTNGVGNSSLVPLARSSDLKVESVVEFYTKWKLSTGKSGSGRKPTNQK